MKECKKCNEKKQISSYYGKDSTCKECRKLSVRENRARNIEYYREYDRKRYKNDPKVKERHSRYLKTANGIRASERAKENWRNLNPVKRAAHVILGNAVKNGILKKPGICESCDKPGRIHGHHCDYSKPLDVMWLCPKCHKKWHDINGEGLNG